ncbi:19000_t:CDS:2, partial [Gigaspora margarita]
STFTVIMSPDPLISPHLTTITIAKEEVDSLIINSLASLVITIDASVPVQHSSVFPVCNSTDCPIFSGTKYTQTVTFLLNATLSPSYQIDLTIGNINSSSPQMLFLYNEILAYALTTTAINMTCFNGKEGGINERGLSIQFCLFIYSEHISRILFTI